MTSPALLYNDVNDVNIRAALNPQISVSVTISPTRVVSSECNLLFRDDLVSLPRESSTENTAIESTELVST